MSKDALKSEAFTKIADEVSKIKIYNELIASGQNIQFKESHQGAALLLLGPMSIFRQKLSCQILNSSALTNAMGEGVASFQVGDEKYYAALQFESQENQVFLSLDEPLFHLQRREDFRLKIPESLKLSLKLTTASGETSTANSLLDLSSGGLKAETDLNLQIEDKAQMLLSIEGFKPINASVRVKFQKPALQRKGFFQVGLQFDQISDKEKNAIFSVVMDLYKELFKKF